ncbi:hypothetical protein R3P38DRAFT_3443442 [Favolaschia claudopus]|uniref:Uncharacterized protein n=1 Tax=Favolaschia claudopus TaxID=2862362 RepID=A0AAV9ZQF4_9AGAR
MQMCSFGDEDFDLGVRGGDSRSGKSDIWSFLASSWWRGMEGVVAKNRRKDDRRPGHGTPQLRLTVSSGGVVDASVGAPNERVAVLSAAVPALPKMGDFRGSMVRGGQAKRQDLGGESISSPISFPAGTLVSPTLLASPSVLYERYSHDYSSRASRNCLISSQALQIHSPSLFFTDFEVFLAPTIGSVYQAVLYIFYFWAHSPPDREPLSVVGKLFTSGPAFIKRSLNFRAAPGSYITHCASLPLPQDE